MNVIRLVDDPGDRCSDRSMLIAPGESRLIGEGTRQRASSGAGFLPPKIVLDLDVFFSLGNRAASEGSGRRAVRFASGGSL